LRNISKKILFKLKFHKKGGLTGRQMGVLGVVFIINSLRGFKGGKSVFVTIRSVDPLDLHHTKSIKNY
jgi:hypothetical protein